MTTDNTGRPIYLCQEPACGSHYLPPADMEYPHGPASAVFCARCQPGHSPAEAAHPAPDLADGLVRQRPTPQRRAGRSPARRHQTGRTKLD
ncbi:hypothetical protein GXW83_32305 [Streptacidiphilus sp. PB12-B1b]|uniref:hypothetical protein n=1 Tax=Streptacidiphilus sp. PB12-B1b TaxID=2705012 RepID=UPI0015F8FDCF|nr:hypothetical protein [Streptacidiphilus sp. PB12-B1b]QMU79692.1 hypothetical protein GXW83_32305 [Streptacidiphilus sp. PB12-B1b]